MRRTIRNTIRTVNKKNNKNTRIECGLVQRMESNCIVSIFSIEKDDDDYDFLDSQ